MTRDCVKLCAGLSLGAVGAQADTDIVLCPRGTEGAGADADAALYLVVLPGDDGGQVRAISADVPGRGPVDERDL